MKKLLSQAVSGAAKLAMTITALLLGFGGIPAMAEPVALILETRGDADPPAEAYTEIEEGTAYALGDDAEVIFLHYPTCQEVQVRGGRLTLSAQQFTVGGGRVVDVKRSDCPQSVSIGSDQGIGGAVFRAFGSGGGGILTIPAQPTFRFVGSKSDDLASYRILSAETELTSGAIEPGEPLTLDEPIPDTQDLKLVIAAGSDDTVEIPLRVSSRRSAAQPVIIRVN